MQPSAQVRASGDGSSAPFGRSAGYGSEQRVWSSGQSFPDSLRNRRTAIFESLPVSTGVHTSASAFLTALAAGSLSEPAIAMYIRERLTRLKL